ncbi:MAG: DUF429 domain-containing protein [Leptothrix sp. (in: b-proteobacteria)]
MSPAAARSPLLRGIDFSSRPTRRKPIVVAEGRFVDAGDSGVAGTTCPPAPQVQLLSLRRCADEAAFAALLREPGPWLGAFDLPFGLPRELVEALGWPTEWLALMRHYLAHDRAQIRATFAAFCAARPAGGKFAHRTCDGPAGSSPSMKWVNPPVAYMLHAGVAALLEAGCDLPGLHAGDPQRQALEAYPGLLARELIGRRPYKSDDRAKQTPEREAARVDLVDALAAGRSRLGWQLVIDVDQRKALIADASGDALDAVLCLLQAAWGSTQPNFGWPADVDRLEGWILSA